MDYFLAAFIFTIFSMSVEGHGRLVDPPSRNAMWRYGFLNPPNYDDNGLNCGGFSFQWNVNKGKCGVCGDPYGQSQPHIYPGKYANNILTKIYKEGQVIDVKVEVTANHKGYFIFTIGDVGNPPITEEKLNHVLKLAGTDDTRYFLPQDSGNGIFVVSLQLPLSLVCAHCVFRWWYTAGNSWGSGTDGTGIGKGAQETFVNCADIRILGVNESLLTSTIWPSRMTTTQATRIQRTTDQTTTATSAAGKPLTTTKSSTTSGDNCRAAAAFSGVPGMDGWCKLNCPRNCPKSHCICTSTEPGKAFCKSAGAYEGQPGMDTWCQQNCPAFCPKTHCICI